MECSWNGRGRTEGWVLLDEDLGFGAWSLELGTWVDFGEFLRHGFVLGLERRDNYGFRENNWTDL